MQSVGFTEKRDGEERDGAEDADSVVHAEGGDQGGEEDFEPKITFIEDTEGQKVA